MSDADSYRPWLDALDERIVATTAAWPDADRDALAGFLLARQTEDGGFAGPAGPGDLYFTGWAVRALRLIGRLNDRTAADVGRYLAGVSPREPIELASWLLAWRAVAPPTAPLPAEAPAFRRLLEEHRSDDGGIGRTPHAPAGSTYVTFLAVLAGQMLEHVVQAPVRLLAFLGSRRRANGGFAETPAGRVGAVNPTAAAVAILLALPALPADGALEDLLAPAGDFLLAAQSATGGWRASPLAPQADLLSSFTALVALTGLGRLAQADLVGAREFARACRRADGGFAGLPADAASDVEFTCYGISALALLGECP